MSTHRNAALAELRPEQLPVAEQLLRGGIPAVRNAIEEQNARARAEGRAEVSPDPLLTMAEELLPRMNLAAWKDRAVAARNAGKDAPLREVRSVVAVGLHRSLDDEGREMVTTLRDALQTRVTALRDGWLARIVTALDDGRVADALRVSARPPEPAARVPADLAVRLGRGGGQRHVLRRGRGRVEGAPRGRGRLARAPDGQAGRAPRPRRRGARCLGCVGPRGRSPSWPGSSGCPSPRRPGPAGRAPRAPGGPEPAHGCGGPAPGRSVDHAVGAEELLRARPPAPGPAPPRAGPTPQRRHRRPPPDRTVVGRRVTVKSRMTKW